MPTSSSRTSRSAGWPNSGSTMPRLSGGNPRLVYCSITGFGQTGPYADARRLRLPDPGHVRHHGPDRRPAGEPQKVGVAFADILTGLYGAIAIQAAMPSAHRTGRGQAHRHGAARLRRPAALANQAMNYLASGVAPRVRATRIPTSRPTRCSRRPTATSSSPSATTGSSRRLCAVLRPRRISPPIRAMRPTPPGWQPWRTGRHARRRACAVAIELRCCRRWNAGASRLARSTP